MKKSSKEELQSLSISEGVFKTKLTKKFEQRKAYEAPNPKKVFSFIPGTIIKIKVFEGQEVKEGDVLLILEAMKMQNKILSPISGEIKKIYIDEGTKIPKGELMLEFK